METAFSWQRTGEVLRELAAEHELVPDAGKQRFSARDDQGQAILHVQVPPLQAIEVGQDLSDYLTTIEVEPDARTGVTMVVLLQAGACSIGLWVDAELLYHKVFKRYVIRGQGKAQPTHLKAKGKSRYGSRLRLQQAKRLLAETNERMADWADQFAIDRCYYAAPVRLWTELFEAEPRPPFPIANFRRIPRDFDVPGHEELLRAWRELGRGRVVRVPID